jgi:monoamine oxidase
MPRTPLFRLLQRSLHLAQASLRTGVPTDELAGMAARWRESSLLSRRQLLGGAAATAGLALAGCKLRGPAAGTAKASLQKGEVLIVGAGIAGLTAAYRLHQANVPVRVLEAQNRVGGRMFSKRGVFPDDHVVELGGELIDTGHTHVQKLAAELGLTLDDYQKDDPKLARDVWFFGGRRRSEAEVATAFKPIAEQIEKDKKTITGDWVSHAEPNNGQALDHLSIAQWLDRAGAEGWFRQLLDVAYTTEYGREIAEQSALNFLMMIDPTPEPFKVFGESDERFHVRGGNDQIPAGLAQRLGDRVETGVRLEAIAKAADGTFRCSVRRGATSQTLAAERLVLAIPFTLLRQVKLDLDLPPVKKTAIETLGYGTNAKLMVGFSERLWRTAGGSNGSVLSDLPFQLTWETTRRVPGTSGVLVDFTGGKHGLELGEGTASHQAELFAADLERIFPGVAERRLGEVRFHWPTFEFTQGSYACYLPGQWTGFGGAEGERVGNLHFCGEHCSADAQGFMEGGCATGEAVADEILVDLGLKKPEAPEKKAA